MIVIVIVSVLRVDSTPLLASSNDSRTSEYSPGSRPIVSMIISVEVSPLSKETKGSSEPFF